MMNKIFTTKNLIYLTALSTPLYLIRFDILSMPTNLLEMFIILTFISFVLTKNSFSSRKFCTEHKGYILAISFILMGLLLSLLVNGNYLSGLGIIKSWFVLPLFFSFVILNEIKNLDEKEKILKLIWLSAFFVSLIGIFYFLTGRLTYDGRLSAFYLSPNHLAMFLAPAVFIGFHQIKIRTKYSILPTLTILTALFLAYSYATWVSIISSFAIIYFLLDWNKKEKNTKKYIFLIILLFGIISVQSSKPKFNSFLQFSERSSLASRIIIWKSSVKILNDNVFFGIGPGNFQNKYLEYQKYFPPYLEWAVPHPHNLYLAFWLQGGLMGFGGFIYLLAAWIKKMMHFMQKQQSSCYSIATALLGIILYLIIHGLIDTTYWKNDLSLIFWIIFSLGVLLPKNKELAP